MIAYENLLNAGAITTLPTTAGAIVTNGAGETRYITNILIHNGDTVTRRVTLYKVPASGGALGTPAATNEIFRQHLAPGGDVCIEYAAAPGDLLETANDAIFGVVDTAGSGSVTIRITGRKDS